MLSEIPTFVKLVKKLLRLYFFDLTKKLYDRWFDLFGIDVYNTLKQIMF